MSKEKNLNTHGRQTGKVYCIVKDRKKVTVEELRKLTDVNYNSIRSSLIRLTSLGLIERVDRGTYKIKEEKAK